eukprot:94459_1
MASLLLLIVFINICFTQNIDQFIENEMATAHIAALSVVVIQNSTILFSNAYGLSNPNTTHGLVNNTNQTIFNVASISKTITSFGIMSLFDKGLFKLDDNINDYLPFPIINPHYSNDIITFKMLMTHTSSMSDNAYFANYVSFVCVGDSNITLSQFIYDMLNPNGKYYSKQSWNAYKPGSNWDYCNIGVALLGYIAECIINDQCIEYNANYITFDQYILDNIWKPMKNVNIEHIGFHLYDFSYSSYDDIFAMPSTWNIQKQDYITYCLFGYPDYPDGLWRTSALNYQPLFSTFIDSGMSAQGVRILNESTINQMKTIYVRPNIGPELPIKTGQALLFYTIHQNGRTMLGHSGGDDGVCCDAFYNPNTGVGYIILGNCDWNVAVTVAFREIEAKLLDIYDPDGRVNDWDEGEIDVRMHHNVNDGSAVCGLPY